MRYAAVSLALLVACEPQTARPDPTALPDLTGLERPVARLITARQAKAAQSPTAQTLGDYARVLHTHGMLDHAERAYLAAIERTSGKAQFDHLYLAAVAISARDQVRAVDMLRDALELRPDYTAAYLLLGRLLESLERLSEAKQCYEAALERGASSHARLGLSRVYLAQGDAKAAVEHLQSARQMAPDHREIYEALARCLARLGRIEESAAAARRVGDLDRPTPYHDELQLQLGDENVSTEARVHRGARLAQSGQTAAAIKEFRGVLEVRPDHIEAHDYLALIHEKERPREALPHLDAILRTNPNYARALELRARILIRFNQRARAAVDLQRLLRVDPNHAWARQQLKK